MADPEPDGLDETAERLLQITVTAAAQLAERVAQVRAHAAREAQALSARQAREYTARTDVERRAAQAQLSLTREPRWWDTATRLQITDEYTTAMQWADVDPNAARDADRIFREVRERYGAAVPDMTATAATEQTQHDAHRPRGGIAQTKAQLLVAADARDETAMRVQTWLTEHTDDLPTEFSEVDAVAAVDARLRAELFQPVPPTEATDARSRPTDGTSQSPSAYSSQTSQLRNPQASSKQPLL